MEGIPIATTYVVLISDEKTTLVGYLTLFSINVVYLTLKSNVDAASTQSFPQASLSNRSPDLSKMHKGTKCECSGSTSV